MTKKQYGPLQELIQKITASAAGARLVAPVLHHFDRALLGLSRGRNSLTSMLAGAPVVLVTATGARSGLARTVPLLCIQDEDRPDVFALIATNFGRDNFPGWYHNLKANPRAVCAIGGHSKGYLAHEASGEEYARFWQWAVDTYFGYALYKQRVHARHIPIMVMVPEPNENSLG
jgi:deazaflavin-dependent oxidoreductase (nitroreductase family)